MTRFLLAIAVATLAACSPVERAYVEADRATFEAIAPEYLQLVDEDVHLSDEQKEDRRETVRSWKARLEQAEGSAE